MFGVRFSLFCVDCYSFTVGESPWPTSNCRLGCLLSLSAFLSSVFYFLSSVPVFCFCLLFLSSVFYFSTCAWHRGFTGQLAWTGVAGWWTFPDGQGMLVHVPWIDFIPHVVCYLFDLLCIASFDESTPLY